MRVSCSRAVRCQITRGIPPARVIDMERDDRLYISYDLQGELIEMSVAETPSFGASPDTYPCNGTPRFELIIAHEAIRVAQETRCGRSYPPLESGETSRGPTRTAPHRTAQACCRAVTEHVDSTSAHFIFHCAGRAGIRSPGFGRCLLED
jgi:hypothetical protein